MLWLASAELAAAVSDLGALGVLSPYAGMEEGGDPLQNLRSQIRRTRIRTQKPFGVNIPLDLPSSGLLIDILLQEQVKVAITAAGNPGLYTELLRSAGIRVAHVVSSVLQARRAESCGVDCVIAEGVEAGGRLGRDELSLVSLVPLVVEAVSVPVIAAGGVATLEDVKNLYPLTLNTSLIGAVSGRALYEGTLNLGQANAWIDAQAGAQV